ncbi:conserved hypothetical protein [Cellvibrio japonicus Ueda107]|uniref:Copper chaperone PCu(A)C n=2 Tax=Cellvibrio japonicus TaxID=155077 RepID=B3PBG9_CELJU|nr:conserved hypothetical protein [Cellvibrio japonicus Ueda107]QEI13085.1 copper chaperone PCu(A)C [Cellvibrio japonicus]QEI16659.1 copper chaperone PCu(A)C [Cellvibrio japonicus]QEI20237.1 copper chaperone PCu(A)C [Cellvibrio japonicus]
MKLCGCWVGFFTFLLAHACVATEVASSMQLPVLSSVKAYDARVIVPLPGVQEPQVFVRLQNTGDKNIALVSAHSAYAERIVIRQVAGSGKPVQVLESLPLPAKTLVELNADGAYLLLQGLKTSLQTGDKLHLELGFSDKTRIEVTAIARSAFDRPHH